MVRESTRDRRARVAAMQAQQKAAERRRLLAVIAACAVVILAIAGGVAWAIMGERNKEQAALDKLSNGAASAACDPVITDPAVGSSDHFGPGTNKPEQTKAEYTTVPPSSGPHLASPVLGERRVYTVADAPAVESLVHNLEHGYTILWYDPSVEKEQAGAFDALAKKINAMPEAGNKFLITPWDTSRGAFPAGKKYALSHWFAKADSSGKVTEQAGKRQLCGGLSTEVVESFVKANPWSAAPEAGAA
ncbi:MAG TPA: DUF3105 domain-containing protein [Intrasporangium sp.]|uniref:DUF3105 domain-containing protein n=1 Tax=Intrasporangium sp. TaxID=1925024 RepID=UPI002D795F4E|nr:DUF3105 domain-containing protein [Intrasporangium sp.]HET7399716.1 DUF3105 domain-containing protein [Intrasporangium sp.]